jgi:hypothetical protein
MKKAISNLFEVHSFLLFDHWLLDLLLDARQPRFYHFFQQQEAVALERNYVLGHKFWNIASKIDLKMILNRAALRVLWVWSDEEAAKRETSFHCSNLGLIVNFFICEEKHHDLTIFFHVVEHKQIKFSWSNHENLECPLIKVVKVDSILLRKNNITYQWVICFPIVRI